MRPSAGFELKYKQILRLTNTKKKKQKKEADFISETFLFVVENAS